MNETDGILKNGVKTENGAAMDHAGEDSEKRSHRSGGDEREEDAWLNYTETQVVETRTQPEEERIKYKHQGGRGGGRRGYQNPDRDWP